MKRPSKKVLWVFIDGITGFFARTELEFILFNVTSFYL